jgi:cell wall-associated NlpC family hydrolase
MAGRVSGLAVFYATAGGILLWSGLKGQTIKQTIQAITTANSSALSQQGGETVGTPQLSITPPVDPSGQTQSAPASTPSGISNDALRYVGHAYLFGGAPGPNGTKPWDCSSFANWVLGHDLNMILPGSSKPGYNGASHGPNTLLYLAWGSATTVSHKASDAMPGDLLVWQTHMGFALGGDQMVSALNESLGTKVTSISGGSPGAEVLFVRRIKGTSLNLPGVNPGAPGVSI